MMQADSEKLRQAWIKAVQSSIATAFRDKGEEGEVQSKRSRAIGYKDLYSEINYIRHKYKDTKILYTALK